MKNRKVILICGYARGGTNILWNILQSHPDVCAPKHETGQVFRRSWRLVLVDRCAALLPAGLRKSWVDEVLFDLKMKTLDHPANRFRREGELYDADQVAASALCLKSVHRDLPLTETLLETYPDLSFIALTRNGYALCDGLLRRGRTVGQAAKIYQDVADRFADYEARLPRYRLVRFEDLLRDPFAVATELYRFLELSPVELDKLRLKSKRVMNDRGEHVAAFGEAGGKSWFDRESISGVLAEDVDRTQAERLSPEDREVFREQASGALEYYGY